MDKILLTQGGQLKSADMGRDSWDFSDAIKQTGDAELYAKVAAVYRAANLTADAVSNVPFAVMRNDTDIDTSAEWKNVIGIMPNPRELLRLWTLSLFFSNAAYGRISKTNSIKRRIFYVMPQNVEIITDPMTGEVKELQRKANGMVVNRYAPTDYKNFVYMWHLDHTTELLPSANTDFKAMSQAAGIMYNADYWTQNYFKNGAVKPTILSVKGMLAPDKQNDLQGRWARFMRGLGRALSDMAMVMNGDAMDAKTIGDGLGDIKDSPVYRQAIENIAMASGMPLSLLLANSANYATAQTEYAIWFRDKITPKAYEIQEWLNEQMFTPAGMYFEFRPEQSEPSQQEEVERANAYSTYISAGMLPSIAAQVVGLDLPAGIEYEDLNPEEKEETPEAQPAPAPAENVEVEDEAQQEGVEMEDDEAQPAKATLSFAAWQELDIWKRKATKALKRGEPLPVDFVCHHIPDNYADTIRTLLQRGEAGAAFVMNYAWKHGDHDQSSHGNRDGGGERYDKETTEKWRDTMVRELSSENPQRNYLVQKHGKEAVDNAARVMTQNFFEYLNKWDTEKEDRKKQWMNQKYPDIAYAANASGVDYSYATNVFVASSKKSYKHMEGEHDQATHAGGGTVRQKEGQARGDAGVITIGKNEMIYRGGQFLPTTELAKQAKYEQKKAKAYMEKKQEIASGVWETPPSPTSTAVQTGIAGIVPYDRNTDTFDVSKIDAGTVDYYRQYNPNWLGEVTEKASLYNIGFRWREMTEKEKERMYKMPKKSFDDFESDDIQSLAAAINAATKAALQPAPEVKAAPQPVINVTMPSITLNAQMPQQDAPSVTVNIPEQPAPVVTVTNEVKTQTPVVNNVVNVPPRPPVTAELTVDPRTGKKILKAK